MDNKKISEFNSEEGEFRKIVSIADIHFGKLDPKLEYDILNDQVLNRIDGLPFDIFLIAGDLFNHKELSNSEVVKYSHLFINRCIDICAANGATLVLLHGTYEHDANQLKMFYGLSKYSNCDIRIINHAKFEYIKGLKILCIPEEYGMGEEYYKSLLRERYDLCFAHATYVGSIHGKNKVDLNSRREPVFDMNCFKNSRGPILSGHVHTAKCFNKHFYYHGSPIRSQFGEEEAKGFYCTLYNKVSRMYYVHFEEIISHTYNTYDIDDIIEKDIKDIIKHIEDNCKGDYVRLVTTKNNSNITLLKEYIKSHDNIKIQQSNSVLKNNLTNNNVSKSLESEFDFIFSKELNSYDIMARYINKNEKELNKKLTGDDIKNILDKLV